MEPKSREEEIIQILTERIRTAVRISGYVQLTEEEAKQIATQQPDLHAEWMQWLGDNFDMGNYDVYRNKNRIPSEMVVETYMPPHLVAKITKIKK